MGDLQDVSRYKKKAEGLSARLQEATEKIDGFNLEEDAFDWDRSQYPLKEKLVKVLDPFLKLYKTIVDYQTKSRCEVCVCVCVSMLCCEHRIHYMFPRAMQHKTG